MGSTCSRCMITDSKGEIVLEKTSNTDKAHAWSREPRDTGKPRPWHHLTCPPLSVLATGAPSPATPGCSGGSGPARSSCQVTREMFGLTRTHEVLARISDYLSRLRSMGLSIAHTNKIPGLIDGKYCSKSILVWVVRVNVYKITIQFLTASFRVFFTQKISYFSEVYLPFTKTRVLTSSV